MQSEPVGLCLQCMLLINTSIPVRRGVRKCKAGQPLFSADCPLRLRSAVGTQRLGFLVVWQCLHTHGWSEDRAAWGRRVASYVHSGWKREETWIQVLRSALKCFWQVSINFVLPIGFTVSAISTTLTYSLVTSCLAKSRDTSQSSFVHHFFVLWDFDLFSYCLRNPLPSHWLGNSGRSLPCLTWECEQRFRKAKRGLWQEYWVLDENDATRSRCRRPFPKGGALTPLLHLLTPWVFPGHLLATRLYARCWATSDAAIRRSM